MKLKDCKHGVLVEKNDETREIGMIVGVTNNCVNAGRAARGNPENTVILVQWAHGKIGPIHPSNVNVFNDPRF